MAEKTQREVALDGLVAELAAAAGA